MVAGRVLFVDNASDFLNTRAEFLENAGYRVLKAYNLEQAWQLLADAHFHLLILDIRLVNDDDEMDVSGLTLAKDPTYSSIPKIILTGFPSVQAVKEALGPSLDGLPPAVDFIAKSEGPDAMIGTVSKAFAQFVRINLDLDIQWDQRESLSFPHLVNLVQRNLLNDMLVQRADELEDLIRCLFYDHQQIRIGRLLWHDHWRFCLPVLARSPQGTTDSRLLVCGNRECLEQDREKLEGLAPKTIQGSKLSGTAETIHFGANIYELPGADIETVQTLRELIRVGKERPLKAAFDHLLGNVLKGWHQHGQVVQETSDLMSLCRQWVGLADDDVYRKEFEQRVGSLVQSTRTLGAIEIKLENEQVMFHFPHQSPHRFPDPVATVYTPLTQCDAPVVCKISPGKLTADNVLVDAKQNTWLTDFAHAGQAPQWWDFICLEAAIRFDLSQAPDLQDWQEFEECLVKPTRLDEKLEQSDVVPELRTSIALIEQVRRQASSETGPASLPYNAGLLAWAVEAMARYDAGVLQTQADRLRGAHLLLAASMIAGRLGTVTDAYIPEGQLRLDEDGRVWIGERRVATLAGLSQKLLACLFEHEGQMVNNRMIVEAYGEQFIEGDSARERSIRQEVSRLRENVEPDPKRPRYILTERGKGYRLKASGEPDK